MLDLQRVAGWIAERKPGHSLPQGLYNDPDAFDFDMEAIFARCGSWSASRSSCPRRAPGWRWTWGRGRWSSPAPATAISAPSTTAAAIAARKICPTGKGASPRLVCPYHRWTYELSGELAHAARMGDDFDAAEHGLGPVAVESVGGVLYVCLADEPPPIADFQRDFAPLLGPHRLADVQGRVRERDRRAGQLEAGDGERARVLPLRASRTPSWPRASPSAPRPTSTTARTAARRTSPPGWRPRGLAHRPDRRRLVAGDPLHPQRRLQVDDHGRRTQRAER